MTTRNDAKGRELTCGYVNGVDGINTPELRCVSVSADHCLANHRELTLLMLCGLHDPLGGPVVDPRCFGRGID